MKLSELDLDPSKVENGVWKQFDDDGTGFKIASTSKKAYQNKLGKMMTKAMNQSRARDLTQTQRDDIVNRAMLGTIVTDFRGWLNDDGTPMVFNDENVLKMLSHPNTRIRDFIRNEAGDDENFKPDGQQSADGETTPEARLKSGADVPA
jgi:hypothetical protein